MAYHFVVVGGGSAGAALPARLSEDPNITVALIEPAGARGANWKRRGSTAASTCPTLASI
jgi:choline dehydrogenase-like flavoprotein